MSFLKREKRSLIIPKSSCFPEFLKSVMILIKHLSLLGLDFRHSFSRVLALSKSLSWRAQSLNPINVISSAAFYFLHASKDILAFFKSFSYKKISPNDLVARK